jgi:hypothetical protein
VTRRQRTGPRGERPGRRVQCSLPAPATLAGKTGTLIREIQNGRQWLIEFEGLPDSVTYPSGLAWLWTCDFTLLPRRSTR